MEKDIYIEHLISLISPRTVLWGSTITDYHNRVLVTEALQVALVTL